MRMPSGSSGSVSPLSRARISPMIPLSALSSPAKLPPFRQFSGSTCALATARPGGRACCARGPKVDRPRKAAFVEAHRHRHVDPVPGRRQDWREACIEEFRKPPPAAAELVAAPRRQDARRHIRLPARPPGHGCDANSRAAGLRQGSDAPVHGERFACKDRHNRQPHFDLEGVSHIEQRGERRKRISRVIVAPPKRQHALGIGPGVEFKCESVPIHPDHLERRRWRREPGVLSRIHLRGVSGGQKQLP